MTFHLLFFHQIRHAPLLFQWTGDKRPLFSFWRTKHCHGFFVVVVVFYILFPYLSEVRYIKSSNNNVQWGVISFLYNFPTTSDWLHRLPQFDIETEFIGTWILVCLAAELQELWLRLELVEKRTDSSLLSCLNCPAVTISLGAAGDERSLCEFEKKLCWGKMGDGCKCKYTDMNSRHAIQIQVHRVKVEIEGMYRCKKFAQVWGFYFHAGTSMRSNMNLAK